MSFVSKLFVLASAASAVIATPYAGHRHGHLHKRLQAPGYATASAGPFPYPVANGTGVWGSTGTSKPTAPAGYGSTSSVADASTTGELSTRTSTIYQTVTVKGTRKTSATAAASATDAPAGPGFPLSVADANAGEQCAAVTVTYTERVTATITEGESVPTGSNAYPVGLSSASSAPAYSAPAETSSPASEASLVESPASPADSVPASSTTKAAPVTTTSQSPKSDSGTSSSPAAPVFSAYTPANKQVDNIAASSTTAFSSASTTSSASASSSTSSSPSSGKRGLAYNDASLASYFSGSREISWAYNWASTSDGLTGDFTFIPTLWGPSSYFVGPWSENAKSAIDAGSTHLFSFNEPDHSAQANTGPAAAAAAYATNMNPFKGQAQLCAPSVTNGGGDMGLTWLKNFLDACTDCQIDCLNIHWYDSAENVDYFKAHIEAAIELADGKPIWVTEFGATGSNAQITAFLEEVMPWMDSNSNIAGYAYFMAQDGILVSGTQPSSYGSTYMSYTS